MPVPPAQEIPMRRASLRPFAFLALAALAALAACGGSGGGGGGPVVVGVSDATFHSTYFAVLAAGGTTSGLHALTSRGTLSANGAGIASHTSTGNDTGTITGPDTLVSTYDVAADGTLELTALSVPFARGGISADGRFALLGSVAPGAVPGFLALARRDGFYDLASLSGAYHLVMFSTDDRTEDSTGVTGLLTFDGAGSAAGTITANFMGTVGAPGPFSFGYTVAGDGASTLTFGPAPFFEGGVAAGGLVGIWSGGLEAGSTPIMVAAVKAATSAGLATLQGSYWIVLLERDQGSREFRSIHGSAVANGAGSVTLFSTSNSEGVFVTEAPQTTTYTVAADGTLTVDAGGSGLRGGISQDGSFAVLGGGTLAGSNPTICLLCRK
jgi:hypothetical protein